MASRTRAPNIDELLARPEVSYAMTVESSSQIVRNLSPIHQNSSEIHGPLVNMANGKEISHGGGLD